jgi:glyoxylase-like metal-dependent hydrolase (beta-lactamase superfamily II)
MVYTFKCKSTYCYLIESYDGYLLYDTGWVNEYGIFRDSLKELGISPKKIKWFMVSHFHIDHAGLAGILINNGKEFIVFENQKDCINEMEELIENKKYNYVKINQEKIIHKKLIDSRKWLETIGINGEIIQIFGHGNQNIALLLDDGKAFIGDLPPIYKYDELVKNDWDKILRYNVKIINTAHSGEMGIEKIME